MSAEERSRDVYERIDGYRPPPLPPLPSPGDYSSLAQLGVVTGGASDGLISIALALAGYRSFERNLPERIEALLRKHNLRLPGVYAPVISATLALADDPRALSPVERAATLILAALDLRDDIFTGRLPADTFRGEPLEMGQYANVFSTNMVVDERGVSVFKSAATGELQLMIGGRLYSQVLRNQAGELGIEELISSLTNTVERGPRGPLAPKEICAGLFTAATAPNQRAAFNALRRSPVGAASLERTKHALMTVCFDLDGQPADAAETALMAHSRHPENRWFHSSLQLVIFGNGKAAAVCNFSTYLDGNTMMRVGSELQKRAAARAFSTPAAPTSSMPDAEELRFEFTPELASLADAARRDWEAVQDDQRATFTIEGTGRANMKGPGVEPVPAFMCALAMTGKQLTGRHPQITQFFTMSRYRCMDMVTGVVTTPEVEQFADAMLEDRGSREEQQAWLVQAVASQQEAARQARKSIPLATLLSLYIRDAQGLRKQVAMASQAGMSGLLKLMGRMRPSQREILVSHPEIYPEVPVVGRPGVRLPYVTCFGLHYQIWDDKTVVTMMPGMNWQTPNAELVGRLRANLEQVQDLLV